MISEAVILAAGESKRMKKGTTDPKFLETPKPLLEINGKSLIAMKIDELLHAGFEVTVIVNKKDKELFMQKLKNYNINYAIQGDDKGTAAALYAAKDFIKDKLFLVLMGDDIFDLSLEEIKKCDYPTVFGYEVDDASNYGLIITNEKGEIEDILEKQVSGKGLVNSGIYVMPREFFDIYKDLKVEENGEKYLTGTIKALRRKNLKFKVKKLSFWFGVNTPENFKRAESILKKAGKI
jgi:bifunctional UDP-N-acetylglucosamine pyrophosphorylase/glucosamine-1-phosphate N-acetyltransferase